MLMSFEINPSSKILHAMRPQLTTKFNDLIARYVICTLQIFEKRKWVWVYICATRTSMIDTLLATIEQQKKEERMEEEEEKEKETM
jgi:hypothetical protein